MRALDGQCLALLVLLAVNTLQLAWLMAELRDGLRRQWLVLCELRDARARRAGDEHE